MQHKLCGTYVSGAGRWKTLGVPVVIGGDNLPSPVGIGLTDLPNIGGGGQWPPWPPRFRHHCMYKQWVTFLPASRVDDIFIVEKFSNKKWIVYSNETKLTTIINQTILCTPSMMSFCLKLYKSRFIQEIRCFLILFSFCLKGQGCLQTCSVTRYFCVGHPFA